MKRIFDIVLSIIFIFMLSPILLILFAAVHMDVGGPFFRQKRVGKNKKIFWLYKFKSMVDPDEGKGLVSNRTRITALGRVLRNLSIDELPSLFNILIGDMSFVGPRPLLVDYLPCYKKKHNKRHNVRPGLTGLAQINGRNNTTWEERLDFDIEYVRNQSFLLDIRIIMQTFFKALKKEGAESDVDLSIVRLDEDKSYKKDEQ